MKYVLVLVLLLTVGCGGGPRGELSDADVERIATAVSEKMFGDETPAQEVTFEGTVGLSGWRLSRDGSLFLDTTAEGRADTLLHFDDPEAFADLLDALEVGDRVAGTGTTWDAAGARNRVITVQTLVRVENPPTPTS